MEDQWELMNKRLLELEEQTRQKVEKLKIELAEKESLIEQLEADLGKSKDGIMLTSGSEELENLLKEYQSQIANFDKEKERYLDEITGLNQKVNNLQKSLEDSAGSTKKLQAVEEQLGVYQEMIKQLEVEKRELTAELQGIKDKQAGSTEQVEQLGVYQELIKQLESEKRDLESELQALKSGEGEVDEKKSSFESKLDALQKKIDIKKQTMTEEQQIALTELKEENTKLKDEIEELNTQVKDMNAQLSQLQEYQSKIETLENEKNIVLQQLQTLENQVATQFSAQEELDRTLQDSNALKQKVEDVEKENQDLKLQIENLNKEIDDLIETNRKQSSRISELESELVSIGAEAAAAPSIATVSPQPTPTPTATPVPTAKPRPAALTPAAPSQFRFFSLAGTTFIQASGKAQGISLELDETRKKWILTIDPSIGFLEKNKALRAARSINISGWKDPDGKVIGKGYDLEVIGEY